MQSWSTRLAKYLLHASERLLLGAVGILQLLAKQFTDFRFSRPY
jgi:hypothetical protein